MMVHLASVEIWMWKCLPNDRESDCRNCFPLSALDQAMCVHFWLYDAVRYKNRSINFPFSREKREKKKAWKAKTLKSDSEKIVIVWNRRVDVSQSAGEYRFCFWSQVVGFVARKSLVENTQTWELLSSLKCCWCLCFCLVILTFWCRSLSHFKNLYS